MNIIVTIKQVPESSTVKMDPETGTMLRTSAEAVINPLDTNAIEAALRMKEEYGGQVTVISMGPPRAVEALQEALAMGCDQAVLLSDRKFAGSDTWATAYVLSLAIKKLGDFDVILCGERTTDGETGQVGPGIAAYLDLPLGTYISKIEDISEDEAVFIRSVEGGRETIKTSLPFVAVVLKEIGNPRLPTVRSKLQAKRAEIPTWELDDLDANPDWTGLRGSPTRVVKIDKPKLMRKGEIIKINSPEDLEKAADRFIQFLKERELTLADLGLEGKEK
ncbi:MAG: electron transfer flavoprotein subunit beta/FixA family protein [Chloroflexota bacterium]|nr:electron transfer flavoprotein subunit beta/FixA family protein [Chloroflexota bacterium]